MKKGLLFASLILVVLFLLAGCNKADVNVAASPSATQASGSALASDAVLEIEGEGVSITLTSAQMLARNQETFKCTNIDSSGNVSEVTVTGFSLTDLLAENGVDLAEIASMNLVASDGYVMSAPAEIYADTEVYIMLNRDGEDLEYPRSCIPEQRSMYWVKNLLKVELVSGEAAAARENVSVKKITVFREAVTLLEPDSLNNRGYDVEAYSLRAYFEEYGKEIPAAPVTMTALDGFTKTETPEIFLANYVTLEAEPGEEDDLPLYFSEDISDGMRVKQLEAVVSYEDAVYFGSGISIPDLFELVGMEDAESYNFIASDGFVSEIPADAIPFGVIYTDEAKGYIRAKFEGYDFGDTPGGGKVKYLTAIEVNG
ncbi:MAG TPA: hypothetical protein GX704_04040 [Clostridiales bacterium]|nr:hypothetical protein [Clostridiales bacterium]